MRIAKRGTGAQPKPGNDAIKETAGINDPNLPQLKEEFAYTLNERNSNVFARARLNHESRYCVWPGQTEDGRKWNPRDGEDEIFPWAGASDARVNLVDLYCKKHNAFLLTLWTKMRTRVNATTSNDAAWALRLTWFLRWMKYTQMNESRAETDLLVNYLLERGTAVKGLFWDKRTQLGYEELEPESLANQCYQRALSSNDSKWLDLFEMVMTPGHDAEAVPLLKELYPDTQSRQLEQACADLRATGLARFPRPQLVVNRPRMVALSPNDDFFISPDATDLENAHGFRVEVMREAKFRAYAKDFEWDKGWVAEMIESQRGNVEFGSLQFNQRIYLGTSTLLPRRGDLDARKLFLVVHAYRRLADANGVPGIFYTVFNPHLTESVAKHELLNYDHGKMPFVLYQTEHRSRKPDDSRGYGEVANTWQGQIKAEWDNRVDRSSIETLPPSHYPPGQQPDKWGPGVQVPTNDPERYGFFEGPGGNTRTSEQVEASVRSYADEYFGQGSDDPAKNMDAQMLKQKLAEDFMEGERQADTQMLQLCQQFMPEDFYFRVVGSAQGKPIHATRQDIQGEFDLQVGFDTDDLDSEKKAAKLGLIQQALQMDVNGIIDRNEALAVAFEMMDPNLGERLLKPAEAASQQEVEDELNTIVKLLVGMKIPVKPGQAYQMRMQVLQQFLQSNQTAQQLYQNNPQVKDAIDQHLKDLNLQLQQQQNAVTGRGGPDFAPKTLGSVPPPQPQMPQMAGK
jgi:hypothetical protein